MDDGSGAMKRVMKRVIDIVVSGSALLLMWPVMALMAIAIRWCDGGPVLFRQTRPGYKGKAFTLLKFRTMSDRRDAHGQLLPDDERLTPLGQLLRGLSLDEPPQLWNVLRGDMSLVGPRPERPEFVERLKAAIPYYDWRHSVRPGITGWAQIRYRYGSSIEDGREKLRYDLFYIKNISPGLDFLIMFDTIKTILLGRGAK